MRLTSPLLYGCLSALLMGTLACKREPEAQPAVCRLTSATDQLVETSGRLTDQINRTFVYRNDTLIGMKEQTLSQEATFGTAYTNGRIVQVASAPSTIGFAYASGGTTPPTSATYSQNGQVQSTFMMEYTASGQMSRITERRQVLPANSLIIERAYSFAYDNAGNLTNERAKFTFRDGLVVEQETEYAAGTKPSPYTHLPQRSMLTVVALSRATETLPGRFWQANAPAGYKLYDLNANGSRGTLRESTTYAPTYDADNKLMTQDQTALLYQASVPDPVTKKNRQAFVYQCNH